MAVFRNFQDGKNIIDGWQQTNCYGPAQIGAMPDGTGANAKIQITSIPSPFARMTLVKDAFGHLVDMAKQNGGDLKGDTIYHKIVSDALDIAELFFNYDSFHKRGLLNIVVWDKNQDLNNLINGTASGHQLLGSSMQLFMGDPSLKFNFNDYIYILECVNGASQYLGGTSPSTLFFSSADDLSQYSDILAFSPTVKPFDSIYESLGERGYNFIEFMCLIRNSIPTFAQDYPEVDEYINLTYQKLSTDQQTSINKASMTEYPALTNGNTTVYLREEQNIQVPMHCNNPKFQGSDFFIHTSKYHAQKPLVLPNTQANALVSLNYVGKTKWSATTKAPSFDANSIDARILPNMPSVQYPYLTVSDFLLDTLTVLKYNGNIDSTNFFDAGYTGDDVCLLPLTKLFFDYFTTEEVINGINGKPLVEIKNNTSDGKQKTVTLNIPINNGQHFVTFTRQYTISGVADNERNIGTINEIDNTTCFVTPCVRYPQNTNAEYIIGLYRNSNDKNKYSFEVYDKDNKNIDINILSRNLNSGYFETCQLQSNYEYVSLVINAINAGCFIPLQRECSGNNKYEFAVDLGTSNTHISYKVNGGQVVTLSFDEREKNIVFITNRIAESIKYATENCLIPDVIGVDDAIFKFPARTALSYNRTLNWANGSVVALQNVNFPLSYQKQKLQLVDEVDANLKWSTDANARQKITAFIENVCKIIRNKVLFGNGDLNNTKITWFYPISMSIGQRTLLKKCWEDAYSKFFANNTQNITCLNESIAPYIQHKQTNNTVNNIVTIDIGGGTTDVVFAENRAVTGITSFRMAANSIFQSNINVGLNPKLEKFVESYQNSLSQVVDDEISDYEDLIRIAKAQNDSADLMSLLFAISGTKSVSKLNLSQLNFTSLLMTDEEHKISFITFFGAIFYHIAKVMKCAKLGIPQHISFSGNGSKLTEVLGGSNFVGLLCNEMFNLVFDRSDISITILSNDNPKEATCKGGLLATPADKDANYKTFIYDCVTSQSKEQINGGDLKGNQDFVADKVIEEVKDFMNLLVRANKKINFANTYNTTNLAINNAIESINWNLMKNTVKNAIAEIGDDNPFLNETLFFHPIKEIVANM